MTNTELWNAVLGDLVASTPQRHFETWFKHTSILTRDASRIVVRVPDRFVKEWLENKYDKAILASLQKHDTAVEGILYAVVPVPVSWRRKIARPFYRLASFIAG